MYQSPLVTKFINCMMWQGRKAVAEQIFYGAMTTIQERTKEDPLKVFRKAMDNVKPAVEVKSRRVGGSNYQVPIEVRPQRRMALALALADRLFTAASGKVDARTAGQRDHGCGIGSWQCFQEEGRYPPDGGGQQGLRALQVVIG